jgi:hypothetical protein
VYQDIELPPDQAEAWKQDRAGAIASVDLARKLGWKIGDRIILQGVRYPVDIELNLRGIYRSSMPSGPLFFNWDCVEQILHRGKYQVLLIRAGHSCACSPTVVTSVTCPDETSAYSPSTGSPTESIHEK